MDNCGDFPYGAIANCYTTQARTSPTFTSTVAKPGFIAMYINTNERLCLINDGGNVILKFHQVHCTQELHWKQQLTIYLQTALAENKCNLTAEYSANSTCLVALEISQADHISTPVYFYVSSMLVLTCIIDLSVNNSFI